MESSPRGSQKTSQQVADRSGGFGEVGLLQFRIEGIGLPASEGEVCLFRICPVVSCLANFVASGFQDLVFKCALPYSVTSLSIETH